MGSSQKYPPPPRPKIQTPQIPRRTAFELVPGANFWCNLMSGGCPVDLRGFWGRNFSNVSCSKRCCSHFGSTDHASWPCKMAPAFWKLAEAKAFFKELQSEDCERTRNLGMFAQEVNSSGQRKFMVLTFEEFAALATSSSEPKHFYEVQGYRNESFAL